MTSQHLNLLPGTRQQLGLQAVQPHPRLIPWVQCYWHLQTPQVTHSAISENTYPDGGSSLIFCFQPEQAPMLTFRSAHTMTALTFYGAENWLGIRFTPGGAFQLLGLAIPSNIPLLNAPEAYLPSLTVLRHKLTGIADTAMRLHYIERWLLQCAEHAKVSTVQHLLPQLLQNNSSIEQLSQQHAISRRQLERIFIQEVGLPAVQLKTLQRVRTARVLLNTYPERSLTDIALHSGFYDQAQFIHQFKKITQQTPGQYRQRKQAKKDKAAKQN